MIFLYDFETNIERSVSGAVIETRGKLNFNKYVFILYIFIPFVIIEFKIYIYICICDKSFFRESIRNMFRNK